METLPHNLPPSRTSPSALHYTRRIDSDYRVSWVTRSCSHWMILLIYVQYVLRQQCKLQDCGLEDKEKNVSRESGTRFFTKRGLVMEFPHAVQIFCRHWLFVATFSYIINTLMRMKEPSAVGIATGYGLDDRVRVPVGVRIFFSPRRPDRLWGPPNILLNGYRGLSPRVKW
jgi:hypothetical protein